MEFVKEMPKIGLGTWQLTGEQCTQAVKTAIDVGYIHIDTADAYENHKQIAPAITNRESLFITSKIWMDDFSDVTSAVKRFLQELQIDFLDLVLLHWPNKDADYKKVFSELKECVSQGLIKHIGVSNMTVAHLEKIKDLAPIYCNQVEFHPYLYQKELLEYCQKNDIILTAYSPLARGQIIKDAEIIAIAKEVGKSPTQVVLRWMMDKDIVVIPKASSKEHIEDNFGALGWSLSEEQTKRIDDLNRNERLISPPFAEFN